MELWKKLGILTVALIFLGVGVVAFELLFSVPEYANQEYTLEAVSDSTTFTLHSDSNEPPHSLVLEVSGNINGEAKFMISHSDTSIHFRGYELQKDSTGYKYDGDWYQNHVIVTYEPENVTSGSLLITYKFYHL
jgi:uncharacterized protein YpmS